MWFIWELNFNPESFFTHFTCSRTASADPRDPTDSLSTEDSMLLYYLTCLLYCSVVAFFVVVRLPELASLVRFSPAGAFLSILALVGQVSLFISPSKSLMFMVRRLALITLVST